MLRKLKPKTLNFLSLILFLACSSSCSFKAKPEIKYQTSGCLLFPDVIISESDKKSFLKYQNEFDYEFFSSLRNYKDIRRKECPQS